MADLLAPLAVADRVARAVCLEGGFESGGLLGDGKQVATSQLGLTVAVRELSWT